jgi:ankyrin repeat protein
MRRACLLLSGGHYTSVQILLENGADMYAIDAAGFTALHYAAMVPYGGCVSLLLKQAGLWGSKGPRPPQQQNRELIL